MKKTIYLLALLLLTVAVKAQYFQHIYGTQDVDNLTSGVNINIQPAGHFMASFAKTCQGLSTIPVAYTDMAGNIPGAPFFEKDLMLIDNNGNPLHARDPQVFELATGGGFGIIGMFYDPCIPNLTGVFYIQLDAFGNTVAVYDYPPAVTTMYTVIEVGGVERSVISGFGDVFVTGTVVDNTGLFSVFAMRINEVGGGLVWSHIYNILPPANGNAWGKDVAENPASPFGPPSIAVAGMVNSAWSGIWQDDGLILHIDAGTGLPAPHPVILSGTPNTHDHFSSINAAIGGPFPPGFILGGGTMVNGSMDFYILRMDPVVATMYVNSFDFSLAPGSFNECYEVVERLNTACQYEYYAVGHTDNGPMGAYDVMVVKFDQFGNGVAGGEFLYGSPGNDMGRSIEILNIGPPCAPPPMPAPAGLSIFGTWGGPPVVGNLPDMYLIKAYYNGVSGCNEAFSNPFQLPANPTMPHSPFISVNNFVMGNLTTLELPVQDLTLCFAPIIGAGNNNKVANPNNGDQEGGKQGFEQTAVLIPNPADGTAKDVTLSISTEVSGEAEVTVYDMLGKQHFTGKFNVSRGINQLPIEISKTNMAQGIYSVTVKTTEGTQTLNLVVK